MLEIFVEWDNNLIICALQNDVDIILVVSLPESEERSDGPGSKMKSHWLYAPTFGETISVVEIVKQLVYSEDVVQCVPQVDN